MSSAAPQPRIRKSRASQVMVLRNRSVSKDSAAAAKPVVLAHAPRTRICKVRKNVLHNGVCQLKSLNDCSSNALHELSCGHLFCSGCIVAHLKASKRKREWRSSRCRSVSEANLNMKQRKLTCFLCRKSAQCGCCRAIAAAGNASRARRSEGCYSRPPAGMCVHLRQRSNCKLCSKGVCAHNKVRHFCKDCGGCAYCRHGKAKSLCKQCKLLKQGGGSLCEHDRVRTNCKDCGGGSLCVHLKRRSKCVHCGGGSLCAHGRQKYSCTKCKGAGVCEHGTLKRSCKVCRGNSWCSHGRLKVQCRACGGSVFCHHNRRWRICRCAVHTPIVSLIHFFKSMRRECKGPDICPHDKIKFFCRQCAPPGYYCIHDRSKSRCRECKGGSICQHDRIRSACKDCKGGGICEHGNHRTVCKLCGGSQICAHNRVRSKCKDCGGSQICKHGRERCASDAFAFSTPRIVALIIRCAADITADAAKVRGSASMERDGIKANVTCAHRRKTSQISVFKRVSVDLRVGRDIRTDTVNTPRSQSANIDCKHDVSHSIKQQRSQWPSRPS
jgi:hypothetical protein